MNFSAWFKSRTADRVLAPAREMIVDLVDDDSDVLEIGCGTGDLLFRAAKKIHRGVGVDLNRSMIDFANNRKVHDHCDNLEFINDDINSLTELAARRFTLATSTLCLHEMPEDDAVATLELLDNIAGRIIIADYAEPDSLWARVTIELDEFISGHYGQFTRYRRKGWLPYLASRAGLGVRATMPTPIDGIRIWELA